MLKILYNLVSIFEKVKRIVKFSMFKMMVYDKIIFGVSFFVGKEWLWVCFIFKLSL